MYRILRNDGQNSPQLVQSQPSHLNAVNFDAAKSGLKNAEKSQS